MEEDEKEEEKRSGEKWKTRAAIQFSDNGTNLSAGCFEFMNINVCVCVCWTRHVSNERRYSE